jgi:hypothetical protein
MFAAPVRKKQLDAKPVSYVIPLLIALVAVLMGVGLERWSETKREVLTSDAARVADIVAFTTLDRAEDGWVGVVPATWPGIQDVQVLADACQRLTERLRPRPNEMIALMDPEGRQLRNCQAP